jgi:hypothetical protein
MDLGPAGRQDIRRQMRPRRVQKDLGPNNTVRLENRRELDPSWLLPREAI